MLSNKKVVILVTGASQGIGRSFAEEWSTKVAAGSRFLISSRTASKLEAVRTGITQNLSKAKAPPIQIELLEWDLTRPSYKEYADDFKRVIPASEQFDAAIVVHNAFTMGDMKKKAEDLLDETEIRTAFDTNFTSFAVINNAFLKAVAHIKHKVVVNLTAPSAKKALAGLGLCGAGKAAREIFLNTLALENSGVKVLHFDPGLVETNSTRQMRDEIRQGNAIGDKIRDFFKNPEKMLTADQVADRLWKTLDNNEFESGTTVSAFDARFIVGL